VRKAENAKIGKWNKKENIVFKNTKKARVLPMERCPSVRG
jgi:hypothetical protein